MTDWFSPDYATARRRFRAEAAAAGAELDAFTHPELRTPDGEPLTTDVAVLGGQGDGRTLLAVSGTHGVEGFCGSACQASILHEGLFSRAAESGIKVVLVHALNPYGFAHLRRVDHANIDVNRNFVDHAAHPVNEAYATVHPALLLDGWDAGSPERVLRSFAELTARLGPRVVQQAVTAGQYTHPDGLFFGGTAPTWSNGVLRQIAAATLAQSSQVAYIDLHTGLGDWGVGEPIFRGGRDPQALKRARRWYGPEVTVSEQGTSSSTPIVGNTAQAVADAVADDCLLTAITLEFGTYPGAQVLLALCADNWLHGPGAADGADQAPEVKKLIAESFCPADDKWRSGVVAQAGDRIRQAVAGLAEA
jgi:hypothetical protein